MPPKLAALERTFEPANAPAAPTARDTASSALSHIPRRTKRLLGWNNRCELVPSRPFCHDCSRARYFLYGFATCQQQAWEVGAAYSGCPGTCTSSGLVPVYDFVLKRRLFVTGCALTSQGCKGASRRDAQTVASRRFGAQACGVRKHMSIQRRMDLRIWM